MRYHFQSEQFLPYPVERVFAFFSDPANLPRLMPDWQHARVDKSTRVPPLDPAAPANAAGAGTRLTLSFRPVPFSPIRVSWDAEIDQFVLNDHFCDAQLRGPFKYWHHCHRVAAETRNGIPGTLLTDDLHYEVPLGLLGVVANWAAVSGQIRSTFAFRHARTRELLAQPWIAAPSHPV